MLLATIASGYTYKWSHGVPFNHSSAQTNLASSLRMEHVCQSSQTRLQHHQKCSGKSVVPASQPTAFAHHVPALRMGCRAACSANAEDNVRTAALFPMDLTNESVRFAQQGKRISLKIIHNVDFKKLRTKRKLTIVL